MNMLLSKIMTSRAFVVNLGKSYKNTISRFQTTQARPEVSTAHKGISEVFIETQPNALFPTTRVVPMVMSERSSMVLPFEDVPGPKSLKYLANFRNYLSEIGTQLTAGVLTLGVDIGNFLTTKKPFGSLSSLFDEYGPVVRFVSPVGGDIVLINNPNHIEKVYSVEGDLPVRSTLDSLEKYRVEYRHHVFRGLYGAYGQEWCRQRSLVINPLHNSIGHHLTAVLEVCDCFTQKVYDKRNYQDELSKDLYKEFHKWAFDCMGLIMFSKKFTMMDTEHISSQCDMSWMYHSLEKATDAIIRCETGVRFWKLFSTPAWYSLVKHCETLDNLIGKHVLETESRLVSKEDQVTEEIHSLITAMMVGEDKMKPEDVATILMDMLLLGVNTLASATTFLMYHLAKYQRAQKVLCREIERIPSTLSKDYIMKIKEETPYLQACIKETLRLTPPVPLLSRILPKNLTLDRYNIPKGTLLIMSTQDSSMKESNFEDADKFVPERWLKEECKEYHSFASIPFGWGPRKCIGQNISEILLSLITIKILQKFQLEYHYGDIRPTSTFIAKPNKPIKIRFVDKV